jgi:hypothetical protein
MVFEIENNLGKIGRFVLIDKPDSTDYKPIRNQNTFNAIKINPK